MTAQPHVAGQHARSTTRRYAARFLLALGTLAGVTVVAALALGFHSLSFIVIEVAAIGLMVAGDRLLFPIVDRWDRGATGEEQVGAILDSLTERGWRTLHDVSLGRGNVDHIVIGPGGIFTVETKSHRGRIAVARIDDRMLKQAYAEAKTVERLVGERVTPLLVFSRAYLVDRPVTRRAGVVILPGRMLAGHLARNRANLAPEAVELLHRKLTAAVTATR